MHKTNMLFFFNSKDTIYLVVTWTRILMFIKWHIDNLVIYLHEKYNNSKPYSYRQNVVTISSECEFFRVRLYALAIWGKLRCSGNAKTKEKVDIKQLTWHNSDEAMLGAFKINYTVQLIWNKRGLILWKETANQCICIIYNKLCCISSRAYRTSVSFILNV